MNVISDPERKLKRTNSLKKKTEKEKNSKFKLYTVPFDRFEWFVKIKVVKDLEEYLDNRRN